jgi:hypothetical protein
MTLGQICPRARERLPADLPIRLHLTAPRFARNVPRLTKLHGTHIEPKKNAEMANTTDPQLVHVTNAIVLNKPIDKDRPPRSSRSLWSYGVMAVAVGDLCYSIDVKNMVNRTKRIA